MQRVLTANLAAEAARRVRLAGWLHHRRELAQRTFVVLRDATGLAQLVFEDAAARARVAALFPETVIQVDGVAVASAQAPGGAQVHDPEIVVVAAPTGPSPVDLRRRRPAESLP